MIIKRIKGDTYNLDVQILDANDIAIDLTGCTVFLTVKRNLQDSDSLALISKTVTSHTSPTTGETSFSFSDSDVNFIGDFYYDIKIKSVSGLISSVFSDLFILVDHVTIRNT